MATKQDKCKILILPVFITGLAVLFKNNHYLKCSFSCSMTGKLSEITMFFHMLKTNNK